MHGNMISAMLNMSQPSANKTRWVSQGQEQTGTLGSGFQCCQLSSDTSRASRYTKQMTDGERMWRGLTLLSVVHMHGACKWVISS